MKVSRRATCDRYYLLKLWGYGIFLHRLHASEDKGVFHNHPWNGFSFIFGSYYEEKINSSRVLQRWWNFIRAKEHHRLDIIKPVWTLFFHGRRCNEWEVLDTNKNEVRKTPWRDVEKPEIMKY